MGGGPTARNCALRRCRSSDMARPAENVVAFYDKRDTCEQWIKQGKGAPGSSDPARDLGERPLLAPTCHSRCARKMGLVHLPRSTMAAPGARADTAHLTASVQHRRLPFDLHIET